LWRFKIPWLSKHIVHLLPPSLSIRRGARLLYGPQLVLSGFEIAVGGKLDHGLALDAKADLIPDHRISIDPFGDVVLMDTLSVIH